MIVKIINNKSFPSLLKINSIYKVLKETDKMYKNYFLFIFLF